MRAAVIVRWWRGAVLGIALVVFIVTGLHQAGRDALIPDEAADLAAGLVIVEHRDLRMTPEHGALHRMAVGLLPSLLADPIVPRGEVFDDGDWFEYTDQLVSANDAAGRLDDVVFWARVLPLLLAAGTGVGLFTLGRMLFGASAGLLSGLLWLSTPYVVGIGHLSSLDVTFTGSLVLLAIALTRALDRPEIGEAALVGLALGVTLLVRHQAIVLLPVVAAVLAMGVGDRRGGARVGLVAAIVPLAVVWLILGAFGPVTGAAGARFDALIGTAQAGGAAERLAMLVPLPGAWRAGLAYLLVTNESRPAYLLGSAWDGGRLWYLPVSLLLKVPLSATVAVAAGAVVWWRQRLTWRHPAAVLGVVFGVQAVVLLGQSLNLGVRLGLPLLAAGFVVAGPLSATVRRPAGAVLIGALALAQAAAFVTAHPHSLAWMPPPVADGYRVVSDSSVDLGQANDELRREHERDPFVAASVLAPRGQSALTGVPRVTDVSTAELIGRVAVGATPLTTTLRSELSWLRAYCPVQVLEGSILVYRFEEPPDRRPGPTKPVPPCADLSTR